MSTAQTKPVRKETSLLGGRSTKDFVAIYNPHCLLLKARSGSSWFCNWLLAPRRILCTQYVSKCQLMEYREIIAIKIRGEKKLPGTLRTQALRASWAPHQGNLVTLSNCFLTRETLAMHWHLFPSSLLLCSPNLRHLAEICWFVTKSHYKQCIWNLGQMMTFFNKLTVVMKRFY